MRVGTKSILFGVHSMFLHPLFVAAAWWRLYGFPYDPRLWFAFALHDAGYLGRSSMEGPGGETHVELGAKIMGAIFGAKWKEFCLCHSRYYARARGLRISKLCVADKLAFVLTPPWLYLPLARASGELWEYIERSKERQAGSEYFTSEEWVQVNSQNPREWLKGLQSYTRRWVLKHRHVDENHGTLQARLRAGFDGCPPANSGKPAGTTYHFHRVGNCKTQILRDGFDPLAFRPELVGLGGSHFEWGYDGCGPEVTAACVLADFLENDREAVTFCAVFKERVIARLPRCSTWLTGSEILEALESFQIQRDAARHSTT
jgi:hypothetical protein